LLRIPGFGDGRSDDVRRHERSGRDPAADLLGDDDEVEEALAARAPAAVLFGNEQRRPPELGGASPPVTVEAARIVGQLAHLRERCLAFEEASGRLAKELLLGG